jgi:hypothetical protein
MNFKTYVMLGFHINFYHSWRGDTPDEAGFGTDMRVVRGVLDMLDQAGRSGKPMRVYWDTEVYWTFQEILPRYGPDILTRLQARVAAGLDEIVPGPFNNGANHAATPDELRAAVAWSMENPWGSGLQQLFPRVAPFYRPQEAMLTTGQETIFTECGIQGLFLYYTGVPFNCLGAFLPALAQDQRYNPLWLRTREDQPRMVLFPCLSFADLLELGSLENLLLELHDRQQRGAIPSDVLINFNIDADEETWLPFNLPRPLAWLPNTGGLPEFIRVVNRYPWAEFTVPTEYLTSHAPRGELLVRQDLADGAFDGNYSWAEKLPSIQTWTLLEQSRLASYQADALNQEAKLDLDPLLWDGMDSSFFQRLIGLSSTHFGMSTPLINEERQARAVAILERSQELAQQARRSAARTLCCPGAGDALYEFRLFPTPPRRGKLAVPAVQAVSLPLILPPETPALALFDHAGNKLPAALTDQQPLPDGRRLARLHFLADLSPKDSNRYRLLPAPERQPAPAQLTLENPWIRVDFSEQTGIQTFRFLGEEMGGMDFLDPFVSYRMNRKPAAHHAAAWQVHPLVGEQSDGLQRLQLKASLPMRTPSGRVVHEFLYTFLLFDRLPYLLVEVEANFAQTPATDTISTSVQKLRRLVDLRWVEVAPFQLHPLLDASRQHPLRIWKHNYLGVSSFFDLNYGSINPRNRSLDAFNHQVTAGWVAVSDGRHGLLLGENAAVQASMAFCPMRLREQDNQQDLWLNPFGSYFGKSLDYHHLGSSGIGGDFLKAFTGFMHPNGPSYNGQQLRFTLLIAPYSGDEPPPDLQAAAAAYFYPPAALFHSVPPGMDFLLAEDIQHLAEQLRYQEEIKTVAQVPTPTSFLANPSAGQVDLVWDGCPRLPITGYELAWRAQDEQAWQKIILGDAHRYQVAGLVDGRTYRFKLRAICGERRSEWTSEAACIPAAAVPRGPASGMPRPPAWLLLRLLARSLCVVVRNHLVRRDAVGATAGSEVHPS